MMIFSGLRLNKIKLTLCKLFYVYGVRQEPKPFVPQRIERYFINKITGPS